jgi:hypothetical protein
MYASALKYTLWQESKFNWRSDWYLFVSWNCYSLYMMIVEGFVIYLLDGTEENHKIFT